MSHFPMFDCCLGEHGADFAPGMHTPEVLSWSLPIRFQYLLLLWGTSVYATPPHKTLKDTPFENSALNVNCFFSFIFISWRLITLQYCSGFCHTLT